MILKVLFGCYIVLGSTIKGVLQELRVLHVTSSSSGRYRPKLEVGLEAAIGRQQPFVTGC